MKPVVTIVGRPNVGKSTLFNRLIGSRRAIVEDTPGVTRDRNYGEAEWFGKRFTLIDTGGFDPGATDAMLQLMRDQATLAIEEADVILFVMNAREGLQTADIEIARILRQTDKPIFYVANKVEGLAAAAMAAELYAVGARELHQISSEHGIGVYDLMEEVTELLPAVPEPEPLRELPDDWDEPAEAAQEHEAEPTAEDGNEAPLPSPHRPGDRIRVAVVGKPNVGKSTLINTLLGEPRLLASDVPGTTRDSIDTELDIDDRHYLLIDTAGIRRKRSISLRLEKFSIIKALQSMDRCDVAVLLIDATQGVTDQDAKIANLIEEKGRSAVIVVNKWDMVEKDDATAGAFVHTLWERMPFFTWAPVVFVSALTGQRMNKILDLVDQVRSCSLNRISTGPLNRFMERLIARTPPPLHHHHNVKLYFLTQVSVAPPTIVASCNTPEGISPAYKRFLANQLRESFDFTGTPLRLFFRGRKKTRSERGR